MPSDERAKAISAVVAVRDNIALIREWASSMDFEALKANKLVRYAIERAFIAIDAAIRDIPDDRLAAHDVSTGMIAGFRNLLAHTYDDVLDQRVMLTISDDLPALDASLDRLLGDLLSRPI